MLAIFIFNGRDTSFASPQWGALHKIIKFINYKCKLSASLQNQQR